MNEEEKEAQEKAKGFFWKLGWILFLIVIAGIIGAMVLPKMVHAMNWPLNKVQTCTFLNVTGDACDGLWCNVLECNYSITSQACICTEIQTINNTIYVNQTVNVTAPTQNVTYQQVQNLSCDINKSYVDEKHSAFEQRLANDENYSIALKDRLNEIQYQPTVSSSAPNYWFYSFVVVAIVGVIGFVAWTNLTKKKSTPGQIGSFNKGFRFLKKAEPKKEIEEKKVEPKKEIKKKKVVEEESEDEKTSDTEEETPAEEEEVEEE